jgi:hypothetical protein
MERPDLIPILGARLVQSSEPCGAEAVQEALIKALTGGVPSEIHPLRESFIETPDLDLKISGRHADVSEGLSPLSPPALPVPEDDGLIRLRGVRRVQIGGAAREAQEGHPSNSDDGASE